MAMRPTLSVQKKFLFFVIVALAFVYLRAAWLQYSTYRHTSRQTLQDIQSACRIDPSNASNYQLLGTVQLAAFEPELARVSLQRSSELNPWDSRTWVLLSTVYGVTGEIELQQKALEAAYSADPKTPEIAWEVGNLYLVQGDTEKALRSFRTVVENSPDLRAEAFRLSWQTSHNVDLILSEMMPLPGDSQVQFLSFLTSRNENAAAAKVWQTLIHSSQSIPAIEAGKYVDYLLATHDVSAAKRAWTEALENNGVEHIQRGDNLVTNGDFEEPISGVGFDWHYRRDGRCVVTVDDSEGKNGTHSLSAQVKSAFEDAGVYQYVPVTPGEQYELSAFMKSQDIESSSGPRIGVFDAYSGQQYGISNDLLESNVWREESFQFKTGPNTQLVAIKIVRVPANPQIQGKFWIDDVRLINKQASQ